MNKIIFHKPLLPVVISFFLLILISICSCSKSASKISVFAAAGAKPAIDDISKMFEEEYKVKVEINYGGGGEVLSKMEIAKSGDIYIAPEQKFMSVARDKDVVEPETIRVVAYMIPVIVVQKGNPKQIHGLNDLFKPKMRVAVVRDETTLLGKYAVEIFRKAGLTKSIKKNIVTEAARPDGVITMLIAGQVDAAITWHFYQYLAPDKIENIFFLPEELTGIGEMQIAVSQYSRNKKLSEQFVDFAVSSEGKAIFKKHGYIIETNGLKKYWH
ncbi:MAG TPA: molybdate ABC transporter substrate-binding protein [Elusimicrobia bacterium]|nr:molybdate ABC transporter substrate-binding protein [Elusimicrobiota bacterium]